MERNREETYLAAFIFSLLFPSLSSQSLCASCLSYFALHPGAEASNRQAMLQKERAPQISANRSQGTSSCKPTRTYSWIPTSFRDPRKAVLNLCPLKSNTFSCLGLQGKAKVSQVPAVSSAGPVSILQMSSSQK